MKILLKNGRVWDGERFFFADVFAEDGRIVRIADNICKDADFTVDAEGKIVSAGLIDAHVHLHGISSDDIGARAEMGCFPFGVTAAADAEGVNGSRFQMNFCGVKIAVFAKALIKNNKVDFDDLKQKLQRYGDRAVGVKVFFDTYACDVRSAEPLRNICEFAAENNLPVMVHPINSPVPMAEVLNVLGKGDILTHPFHGGNNNASADNYKSIADAKQRGIIMDLGFEGYCNTNFEFLGRAISMGIEPDIISTDLTCVSLFTRGGKYGLTMCMSAAKAMGMSEEAVFKAVTASPARALGREREWGYLKEGRRADIAVLEYADEGFCLTDIFGNSIKSQNGYRNVITIADGQVIYRA